MANDFEGRPIEGEIHRFSNGPQAQDDPELFLNALDNLLNTAGVQAVRWNQYTPYFNDGEACEFSAYGPGVKISGDKTEDDEEYEDEYDLGGFRTDYELWDYVDPRNSTERKYIEIEGVDVKTIYDALAEFESVIESGKHDVVLNEKFGDPAQVTATPDGKFTVEYYEHD